MFKNLVPVFLLFSIQMKAQNSNQFKLAMGTTHGCYISQAQKLFCFGSGGSGELGQGKYDFSDDPIEIKTVGEVISVDMHGSTIGDNNTCAVNKTGQVWCWGSNTYGMLGKDPDEVDRDNKPTLIGGIEDALQVAVGYGHACALLKNNKVACWGANSYAQLGDHAESKSFAPIAIKGMPSDITQIYSGHSHNCVLANANLYCWGANNGGQMGSGVKSDEGQTSPVQVALPAKVKKADLYGDTSCAATDKGVYCWGQSDNIQQIFGQGANWSKSVPEEDLYNARVLKPLLINGLNEPAEDVVIRRADGCALVKGSLQCWGSRLSPNSNVVEVTDKPCSPSTIYKHAGINGAQSISGTNTTMCGALSTGKVKCWTAEPVCLNNKMRPPAKVFDLN